MQADQVEWCRGDGRDASSETAPVAVSTDVITEHRRRVDCDVTDPEAEVESRRRVERGDEVDCFYPVLAFSDVAVAKRHYPSKKQ